MHDVGDEQRFLVTVLHLNRHHARRMALWLRRCYPLSLWIWVGKYAI